MQRIPIRVLWALAFLLVVAAGARGQDTPSPTALVISVAEQKLALLRDGGLIKKFPISTSKFGLGDSFGSYKTPLGKFRVCAKVGDHLSLGAVFKQRHATGEVLPVNAPGRDPIVTRIIWLDGLEPQNANARQRGIYIHGTTEEKRIGDPVSYGCIRMRSKDVVEVYDEIPLEASVTIIDGKFPRFPKYTPPTPQIIAATAPVTPAVPISASPTLTPKTAAAVHPAGTKAPSALTPEPLLSTTASLAMQGSILDTGLPRGPTLPTLPTPPEPKDVPRFNPLSPGLPAESPFSLQGIARDLSPALRAAELGATERAAAAPAPPPTSPAPAKRTSRIAFRAGVAER